MSAAPFRLRDAVTCSLGGPWEHLRGVRLRVEEIRPASTYPGGWAARLGGPVELRVPSIWVGSANLAPVTGAGQVPEPAADELREAVRALERQVLAALERVSAADARAAAAETRAATAEGRALAAEARAAAIEHRLARLEAAPIAPSPQDRDAVAAVARLASYGIDGVANGVAAKHGLSVVDLCSRNRTPAFVAARDEALYAIRAAHPSKWSYPRLGRLFGIDHRTALEAVRRHEARVAGRRAA